MNRLTEAFHRARADHRAALIPYVTAGYPHLSQLPEVVRALTEAGADIIEIGIPFSDPLADGPVLQRAATEALEKGTRVRAILDMMASITPNAPPLVFLTYINPIFRYGIVDFSRDASQAGMCGLIIPDLPWVEGQDMRHAAQNAGMVVIPLVAPTSTDHHLKAIAKAQGFVYGVSVTGVTGMRQSVDQGVKTLVERVKQFVSLPLAIGFGVSTPEQAQAVGAMADGVIVGSALVKNMGEHPEAAAEVAYGFVKELSDALKSISSKA